MTAYIRAEWEDRWIGMLVVTLIYGFFFVVNAIWNEWDMEQFFSNTAVTFWIATGIMGSEADKERRDRLYVLMPMSRRRYAIARIADVIVSKSYLLLFWLVFLVARPGTVEMNDVWYTYSFSLSTTTTTGSTRPGRTVSPCSPLSPCWRRSSSPPGRAASSQRSVSTATPSSTIRSLFSCTRRCSSFSRGRRCGYSKRGGRTRRDPPAGGPAPRLRGAAPSRTGGRGVCRRGPRRTPGPAWRWRRR